MNAITRLPVTDQSTLDDDYTRAVNAAITAGRDELVPDLVDSYVRDLEALRAEAAAARADVA